MTLGSNHIQTGSISKGSLDSARVEDDEINEEIYAPLHRLEGADRAKAIEDAERRLAYDASVGRHEVEISNEGNPQGLARDLAIHNGRVRSSLASLHGVPKDQVIVNEDGDIEVDRADGKVSIYDSKFNLKGTVGGYETDADIDEILADTYNSIPLQKGEERDREIRSAEEILASEYSQARVELRYEQLEGSTTGARDIRKLDSATKKALAALNGVHSNAVVENEGSYAVETDGQTQIYSKRFEKLGSFDGDAAESYKSALIDGAARQLPTTKVQVFYHTTAAQEVGGWPFDEEHRQEIGTVSREDYERISAIMAAVDDDLDYGYNKGMREAISVRPAGQVARLDFERIERMGAAYEITVAPGTVVANTERLKLPSAGTQDEMFVFISPSGEVRGITEAHVEIMNLAAHSEVGNS